MKTVERLEALLLRAAMALPEPVLRVLGGRRVVRDGQTLAADLRLMLLLQRLARERGAETMPIPEGRRAVLRHSAATAGRQPIGSVRDLHVAGLPARLYTPTHDRGALLLFFHGGGYMYGDLESHDAPCRFLAERSGVRVLAVDYRLAPENPFPAAYDDALSAYRWVVENAGELGVDASRIAVGGDSAGGNLAAVVAIEAARTGLPLAFQLLVYPVADAVRNTRSATMFARGFYLSQEFMELANRSYIRGDLRDPRISPQYADLPPGLAPALLVTAGFDPLRDEGETYARRLADAGVSVDMHRFPDQIHGFFNIVGVGRTSRAANALIAAKLGAALG